MLHKFNLRAALRLPSNSLLKQHIPNWKLFNALQRQVMQNPIHIPNAKKSTAFGDGLGFAKHKPAKNEGEVPCSCFPKEHTEP